ncbi:MAG: ABC transporter substrate-binding protein [Actinomycetota bacterium]
MRARTMAALAAALIVAGTLGTGLPAGAQSSAPDEQVTFTFAGISDPLTMNPLKGYLAIEFYFWTASYHLLVDYDEEFGPEEGTGLVTDIEVNSDSTEFTYTIRDDMVWSDGEPVTAEDAAYSLNLYRDESASLASSYLGLLDGPVEVVNGNQIRFRTTQPTSLYSGAAPYLYAYILPEHVWGAQEKPKRYENAPSIGSGPFVIAEFKSGEYVRMERNPYWTGPEPQVDEIIYRVFKNEDSLAEALKAGEVDFAYLSSANIYNSLADEPNIERVAGSIPSFDELAMNSGSAVQAPEGDFVPHGDGHPALADPVVRRAIRMAVDSQQLVDKVLLGYGQAGDTIIVPVSVKGARWQPEGDEFIAWDIPGANAMLDEAGYVDCDGDGIREMPDCGRSLVFRYYARSSEQNTVDTAEYVRPWLAEIGIDAQVEAITSAKLGDLIVEGKYDLFHWGWIPDPDPDAPLGWFTCDSRPPDGQAYGNNDAYYCNPEYDSLYLEQRATLDATQRWEIVQEMQRIFYEDSPYAVLWYSPQLQAYRTDTFTGYNPQPPGNGDLLEGYGGPSTVWWTLRPVGAEASTATTARGLGSGLWGIVALVVALAIWFASRRRGRSDDEA